MAKSFDNGAWTSELAEQLAESSGLKWTCEREILHVLSIAREDGATDQQLERVTGRPGNTVRPGRVQLVKDGLVVNPEGKWRWTESRRPAKVWVLAQYAADAE